MKLSARLLTSSALVLGACATTPSGDSKAGASTGSSAGQPAWQVSGGSAPADPAGKRAMEIADFYKCATLSAPSLSPDGAHVAFAVRRYEYEAGKSWSEVW